MNEILEYLSDIEIPIITNIGIIEDFPKVMRYKNNLVYLYSHRAKYPLSIETFSIIFNGYYIFKDTNDDIHFIPKDQPFLDIKELLKDLKL